MFDTIAEGSIGDSTGTAHTGGLPFSRLDRENSEASDGQWTRVLGCSFLEICVAIVELWFIVFIAFITFDCEEVRLCSSGFLLLTQRTNISKGEDVVNVTIGNDEWYLYDKVEFLRTAVHSSRNLPCRQLHSRISARTFICCFVFYFRHFK